MPIVVFLRLQWISQTRAYWVDENDIVLQLKYKICEMFGWDCDTHYNKIVLRYDYKTMFNDKLVSHYNMHHNEVIQCSMQRKSFFTSSRKTTTITTAARLARSRARQRTRRFPRSITEEVTVDRDQKPNTAASVVARPNTPETKPRTEPTQPQEQEQDELEQLNPELSLSSQSTSTAISVSDDLLEQNEEKEAEKEKQTVSIFEQKEKEKEKEKETENETEVAVAVAVAGQTGEAQTQVGVGQGAQQQSIYNYFTTNRLNMSQTRQRPCKNPNCQSCAKRRRFLNDDYLASFSNPFSGLSYQQIQKMEEERVKNAIEASLADQKKLEEKKNDDVTSVEDTKTTEDETVPQPQPQPRPEPVQEPMAEPELPPPVYTRIYNDGSRASAPDELMPNLSPRSDCNDDDDDDDNSSLSDFTAKHVIRDSSLHQPGNDLVNIDLDLSSDEDEHEDEHEDDDDIQEIKQREDPVQIRTTSTVIDMAEADDDYKEPVSTVYQQQANLENKDPNADASDSVGTIFDSESQQIKIKRKSEAGREHNDIEIEEIGLWQMNSHKKPSTVWSDATKSRQEYPVIEDAEFDETVPLRGETLSIVPKRNTRMKPISNPRRGWSMSRAQPLARLPEAGNTIDPVYNSLFFINVSEEEQVRRAIALSLKKND